MQIRDIVQTEQHVHGPQPWQLLSDTGIFDLEFAVDLPQSQTFGVRKIQVDREKTLKSGEASKLSLSLSK